MGGGRAEKGQENECCLCPRTCLILVCTTITLHQVGTPTIRGQEKKLGPYGFSNTVTGRVTLICIYSREVLLGKPRRFM